MYVCMFMQNLQWSEEDGGADSETEEVDRGTDENHSSITHREQPAAHTAAGQSGKHVNGSQTQNEWPYYIYSIYTYCTVYMISVQNMFLGGSGTQAKGENDSSFWASGKVGGTTGEGAFSSQDHAFREQTRQNDQHFGEELQRRARADEEGVPVR